MDDLATRLAASTDPRDASALRWNQALASGDEDRIEDEKERQLVEIHTRIMNDDPNYIEAGWKK
jgi:hypothetical protein